MSPHTDLQAPTSTRESVPFRVRTADGESVELSYSSPRPAETHDEREVLETLPWFESGKPLRNYMLHETDLYDEVEQVWGRPWGQRASGRCARCSSRARRRTRSGPSTRRSGSTTTPARPGTPIWVVYRRSSTSTTRCSS